MSQQFFHQKLSELTIAQNLMETDTIFTKNQLLNSGVSESLIKEMLQHALLEENSPNIYMKPGIHINDFLLIQLMLPKGVFAFETALYLHQLTDRYPYEIHLSFPMGYKLPQKAAEISATIIPKTPREPFYSLEIEEQAIEGTRHCINVYSKEKTLCDIVKRKHTVEQEIINHAYKTYLASEHKNIHRLLQVARQMKAEKQVNQILEVLL
ncbi:MAG: hypothetical protein FWF59_07180 [Turicibacter sp.]|nr:hypothetical protein [Turicibacter sp.]